MLYGFSLFYRLNIPNPSIHPYANVLPVMQPGIQSSQTAALPGAYRRRSTHPRLLSLASRKLGAPCSPRRRVVRFVPVFLLGYDIPPHLFPLYLLNSTGVRRVSISVCRGYYVFSPLPTYTGELS